LVGNKLILKNKMALKLHKETYDTFVSKFKNKKTTFATRR